MTSIVLCEEHKFPCFLKTGTKDGPNKNKSFYVCGYPGKSCNYVKPTNIPIKMCSIHSNQIIELQAWNIRKQGDLKSYFRCSKGKIENKSWCGFSIKQVNDSTSPDEPTSVESTSNTKDSRGLASLKTDNDQSLTKSQEKASLLKSKEKHLHSSALKDSSVYKTTISHKTGVSKKSADNITKIKISTDNHPIKSDENLTVEHNHTHDSKIEPSTSDLNSTSINGIRNRESSSQGNKGENKSIVIAANCCEDNNPSEILEDSKKSRKESSSLTESFQKMSLNQKSGHSLESNRLNGGSQSQQNDQTDKTKSNYSFLLPQGRTLLAEKADLEKLIARQKTSYLSVKEKLSDGGTKFRAHISSLEDKLEKLKNAIENQPVSEIQNEKVDSIDKEPLVIAKPLPHHVLKEMYPDHSKPLYGGKMNKERLELVQSITTEALEKLHRSLETCPDEMQETDDPEGLNVSLLPHQRQALTWLMWREEQSPPGGILADDMGLGKTLTMISLILKQNSILIEKPKPEDSQCELLPSHCSLVICPASILHQWDKELQRHCKAGAVKVLIYHGPNRERNSKSLSKYDVILTTYNIISREVSDSGILKDARSPRKKSDSPKPSVPSPLLKINFHRIILDEAHNIKNPHSLTSMSICLLNANKRWAVTGTPLQNNVLDMYSLLKFLRCSPFDEYKVWKKWVDNHTEQGKMRLNTLVQSILLRRTKNQKNKIGQSLVCLPTKSEILHELMLSKSELFHYERIFKKSQSIFNKYLLRPDKTFTSNSNNFIDKTITAGAILILLLRLRQCCSHLSLLNEVIDKECSESEDLEIDLADKMKDLFISDDQKLKDDELNVFEKDSVSTKIKAVMKELKKIQENSTTAKEKSVIVSQWTCMLDIVDLHLKKEGFISQLISGSVTAKKRSDIVEDFNNNPSGAKILLVSLRAGGVGLNLIGGNHLFMLDIHWNPALELQACDRIYRVGQKNAVFIHRFLCTNTVEEKIFNLQRRKLALATDIISGSSNEIQKLSLEDLKDLFSLKESGYTKKKSL